MTHSNQFLVEADKNPRAESWQSDSLCATVSPYIFFPTTNDGNYNNAKKICAKCTVREECLRYIMEFEGTKSYQERTGMFAGLMPKERHALSETYFSQE